MLKRLLLHCCLMVIAFSSYGQCSFSISGTQQICSNSYATLNATYSGGGTLHWSVVTAGQGYFSSNFGNNVVYYPSAFDSSSVLVKATVIDSLGACDGSEQYFTISITPYTYVGPEDRTVCVSTDSIFLTAQYNSSPTDTLLWYALGSSGSLLPNYGNYVMYIPSVADKAAGRAYITISSTSMICPVYDSVYITFTNMSPVVSVGTDEIVCGNSPSFHFATVSGASSGYWTTTGSGSISTPSLDSTVYYPSPMDLINGTVALRYTANGCGSAIDEKTIIYLPAPQINVGSDQFLAAQNYLSATFSNATGVAWQTSGSGTFSNINSANTVYVPSPSDHFVVITATTVGASGSCENVQDQLYLYVDSTTICSISAGPDQSKCAYDTVFLQTSQDFTSVEWSTTGNGYLENPYSPISAKYTPDASDSISTVYFIVNAEREGCIATDTMAVYFNVGSPYANTGPDKTACTNTNSVFLNGYTNTANKLWTSLGGGTFGNAHADSTIYIPSNSEKSTSVAALILTAYGCGFAQDTMFIFFSQAPAIEVGPNQQLTSSPVSLSAAISNSTGITWTTSGSGIFSNIYSATTTYIPSQADLDSGHVVITAYAGHAFCESSSDYLFLTGNAEVCNVSITKTVTANEVNFVASNTDGLSVGSYFWDFGDGTYAYGKVQSHVYAAIGTFPVTLVFNTPDSSCSSTAHTSVTITSTPTSTYSISGTIYAGVNTVDHAFVTLFELKNNVYKYAQSVTLDPSDNGNYIFSNVTNGEYLVYAIPSSLSAYLNYIACYFPNVIVWLGATSIDVTDANETGKNIYLVPFTPPNTGWNLGTAGISGTITFDINTTLRTTTASSNPSQYAVISLYNTNGQLLATTNTDEFGNYSFEGIAAGNYVLKVEYPGGKSGSTSYPVTTVEGQTSEVNTEVIRQEVVVGTVKETVYNAVNFYPNPVHHELYVSLSNTAEAQVYFYNSLGVLIYSQNIQEASKIEMTSLPSGIYSYVVIQENQKFSGKIVKQ